MSKSTDPKFESRRMKFTEAADGSKTGALEPTIGPADSIEVSLLIDNRVRVHLFNLTGDLEKVAEFMVRMANNNVDALADFDLRTCCGFMDPVAFAHLDGMHRDIFECEICEGTESGEWIDCDCPKDGPEYRAEEDRLKLSLIHI